MTTNIIVTLQVEGFHWYAGADAEVAFLASKHRHIFYIAAKKQVSHSNREIEFISLKREMLNHLQLEYGSPCEFGGLSCEMIADKLVNKFGLSYCSVMEDNENGAEVVL